ncbi:MAG: hypothetical protein J6V69_05165 [Clostridia bacterium]|nr:hypothetical protein [Clostridia bacterium]
MAQPSTPGFIKGCVIVPLVTILVLVIVVVAGGLIVLNMTPADLGLADLELFEGETLASLGLADIKLKEIPKFLNELMNPDETKILENQFDATEEQGKAESNIADSSVAKKENGDIDYSSIVTDKIIYPTKQNIEYKDTTLAYIFNQMVADGAESSDEAVEFLKELNASISEVSIKEDGTLRIVAYIELASLTNDLKEELNEAGVGSFVKIPERVYLVSYSGLSLDAEGNLVTTSKSLKINDSDSPISTAIMKVLAKKADEVATEEGQQVDTSEAVVNGKIGEAFVAVVSNLGKPVEVRAGAIVVETYTE